MDSTIFNRRTLLGGGALAGLGALLAACGQQANTRRQPPQLPHQANRHLLLLRHLNLHQLQQPPLLSEATRAARRHRW